MPFYAWRYAPEGARVWKTITTGSVTSHGGLKSKYSGSAYSACMTWGDVDDTRNGGVNLTCPAGLRLVVPLLLRTTADCIQTSQSSIPRGVPFHGSYLKLDASIQNLFGAECLSDLISCQHRATLPPWALLTCHFQATQP